MFLVEIEPLLRDICMPEGEAPVSKGLMPGSIGWIHTKL
jgi:hypothetical protein